MTDLRFQTRRREGEREKKTPSSLWGIVQTLTHTDTGSENKLFTWSPLMASP